MIYVLTCVCRHEAELAQAANQPLPDDDDDAFEQKEDGWYKYLRFLDFEQLFVGGFYISTYLEHLFTRRILFLS